MFRWVLVICFCMLAAFGFSQEERTVTIEAHVPAGLGKVYLTGSIPQLGPWKPAAVLMEGTGQVRTYTFQTKEKEIFFVFTLGTWTRKSLGADGKEMPAQAVPTGTIAKAVVDVPAFMQPTKSQLAEEGVTFVERTCESLLGTRKFAVFVPQHSKETKKPIILFLHGSGERGEDNVAQTTQGIRLLISQDTENFPAIVVCPQCPDNMRWSDEKCRSYAMASLEAASKEFGGDPDRTYLTGLSLGGNGTWLLAGDFPTKWAAIAPCCGFVHPFWWPLDSKKQDPYTPLARKIAHIPTWVFHGAVDSVVPVLESRVMVGALIGLHATPKYSEYPGVDHGSWINAYAEKTLLSWFLSHKLSH